MNYDQYATAPQAQASYYPNAGYSSYGQYPAAPQAQAYPSAGYNQYGYGQAQEPPQIRNPFAPPPTAQNGVAGNSAYDPDREAEIQAWNATYAASKDDAGKGSEKKDNRSGTATAVNANLTPLGGGLRAPGAAPMSSTEITAAANSNSSVAALVTDASGEKKTVVRSGGGSTWEDPTLLEWDESHFRIFVGNLAGEVTDESLLKAFSKWPSVSKARVVRDKRTTKSKGYGFVSFANGDDYFEAAKEMQGKYIGSHPVLIRRSTTNIKETAKKDQGRNNKYNKNNKNKVCGPSCYPGCNARSTLTNRQGGQNNKGGDRDALGANTGAGVKKPQGKQQKGQMKVLG